MIFHFSRSIALLSTFLIIIETVDAQYYEGIYCGKQNCYDVLGVTKDSKVSEISRSYRALAKKWHPDRHQSNEDKVIATENFRIIATAYETLKDEESRKDYDYMLDHPEEMYNNYYRYYRRQYTQKVDVRLVIFVTISLISIYQYYGSHSKYNVAIDHFLSLPKYRIKAKDIALSEGIWPSEQKIKLKQRTVGGRKSAKEELKAEEEAILRKVIEDKMDIKGAYGKPSWTDILWAQIFLSPIWIAQYLIWYALWVWKFNIQKLPYGIEEKHYIIRRFMGLSQAQWKQLESHEIAEFMRNELWIKENFIPWKQQKDDEIKAALAENNMHKRYRRYMKKGGPGQITFNEND